jgi:putative solute:sodium symporter small subunit
MTNAQYWRANVRLIAVLLSIWAVVSLGCSVLLIDVLNRVTFFGTPFGFWMAQQGSIYVFLALIGVYVWMMERIDRAHGVQPGTPTEGRTSDH